MFRRETANQVKRKLTEWEKVFITYMSGRRLKSRTYKELKKITKINNPIKKWVLELNREFWKQEILMANKHFLKEFNIISHDKNIK